MPDTMVVIDVDGQYVLTAYGADELIETFKTNALSALTAQRWFWMPSGGKWILSIRERYAETCVKVPGLKIAR